MKKLRHREGKSKGLTADEWESGSRAHVYFLTIHSTAFCCMSKPNIGFQKMLDKTLNHNDDDDYDDDDNYNYGNHLLSL